jgi:hypothetical protein
MKGNQLIYVALTFWILLGFFLRLDYPEYPHSYGRDLLEFFSVDDLRFTLFKVETIFAFLSVSLIVFSWNSNNIILAKRLLIVESAIWLLIYLFVKEGYLTGFGGSYHEEILAYDFFAVSLRLLLILKIHDLNIVSKVLLISIIPLVVVVLKASFFKI